MNHQRFEFRPLSEADLPLMADWFAKPHLQEWWREDEITIESIREKYLPHIFGDDDPRPDNLRAIRCYEKVGFRTEGEIITPDGPAVMMIFHR